MIELSKEQTFQLLWERACRQKIPIKTTSKIKWYCLNCMKEIYVGFNECSLKSIYCESCQKQGYGSRNGKSSNNIFEAQYLRKLKELQVKIYEKYLDSHDI